MPFNGWLSNLSPDDFVEQVLVQGLGTRYILVGDDFCYGAKRAGDYASLSRSGQQLGFEVARMNSYEVRPQPSASVRVSSSAVREALAQGRMADAAQLLGRPYAISGHVVHGRKLGRELKCPTLNLRFTHWKPAASGIFVVQVHGLGRSSAARCGQFGHSPLARPQRCQRGSVLLETHCLDWPAAWGWMGATVNSYGWNCSTNCTTN